MMANPTIATEQLLELLLTLKKTTPEAARTILNNQPTIAYALMTLMVSMNAVNIEVFQKTLAEFGTANAPDTSSANTVARPSSTPANVVPAAQVPPVAPAPISAIPPHLQAQYRTATPPSSALASSSSAPPAPQAPTHTPTPPYGYSAGPNGTGYTAPTPGYVYQQGYQQQQAGYAQYQQYQQQQAGGYPGYSGYGQPAPAPAAPTPALPDSLSGISDEQKALIMRVLAMTPEQINMLPPADRATYIQIRTTLGVPT